MFPPPSTWLMLARGAKEGWDRFVGPSAKETEAWNMAEAARTRATAAREAAENARRFCDACNTEIKQGKSFCGQCGGSRISTLGVINKRAAYEAARIKQEEEQKQQQERDRRQTEARIKSKAEQERAEFEAARRGCRTIASLPYCNTCEISYEFERTDKFCSTCGGKIETIPPEKAFKRARSRFPKFIKNEADFKKLTGTMSRLFGW